MKEIIVLMGGTSPEREVSLNSGDAIYQACVQSGFKARKLILEDDISAHISTFRNCELVFNALHGGQGENGVVQGFLESIDVKYTGAGVLASALCMDKNLSKELVRSAGYATADWLVIDTWADYEIPGWSDFPIVVKPNDLGSTIGLSVVEKPDDLKPAIDAAARYTRMVMLEKYIKGHELTVAVLGEKVLPIVEIKPSHGLYDYACKYTSGMSIYECPARLSGAATARIQQDAAGIFRLLQCEDYSRIDFRMDEADNYWFLEVNTLPGMTATSLVPKAAAADNISFNELILKIITLALDDRD